MMKVLEAKIGISKLIASEDEKNKLINQAIIDNYRKILYPIVDEDKVWIEEHPDMEKSEFFFCTHIIFTVEEFAKIKAAAKRGGYDIPIDLVKK